MKCILSITLIMAHDRKHRTDDYWTTDEVFELRFVRKLMSRDRFLQLLRHLHCTDNTQATSDDKLHEVRPVNDYLRRKFREKFTPFQDLCTDESQMLWNGRLGFFPKRQRFGVKIFILVMGTVIICMIS